MYTLVNRIIELSSLQPDKLAAAFKKERLSYKELCERAVALSGLLLENGIRKGDKVSFSAVSKPDMIIMYLAIHMIGAVAVFLDKNATAENMEAIYESSESVLLATDKPMGEYAEKCRVVSLKGLCRQAAEKEITAQDIEAARISPAEDDMADILFTSGTTGKPKGVCLSYKRVYNILNNTIEGIGIQEDDIMLMPLPLNHSFALRVLRAVLYRGATVILQNGFTFAKEVENNIEQFGCNAMVCVPASYEIIKGQMQEKFTEVLGELKYMEFSAGSLSIQQRKTITELLPKVTIHNTWGSSESGGAIFCNVSEVVKDERYVGALGKPLEGKVQVKIIDDSGNEINSDEAHPGRMALKGDMRMDGYWNAPELTAETIVDDWMLTGDMAYIKDGYIFILGRADSIINVGGDKVSPIEVENAAGQYEGIRECACIGADDPEGILGQIPVLFVSVNASYSEEELIRFLSTKLEKYKIPQKFAVVDALPRNRMQKVDYKALRKLWENPEALEMMNPVIENILSRRSIRRFTDEPVSKEVLEMLLKCGRYAPSGHNMQTWKFTVVTKKEDIERLKKAVEAVASEKKVVVYGWENPSALIMVSNDKRNRYGCQDTSCAVQNILLASRSLGLGSVWLNPLMTLRDVSPVKELLDEFEVPENHIVWSTIALGYPQNDGVLLKKKEDVVHYV